MHLSSFIAGFAYLLSICGFVTFYADNKLEFSCDLFNYLSFILHIIRMTRDGSRYTPKIKPRGRRLSIPNTPSKLTNTPSKGANKFA
jgi:hypothetical protein